MTYLIPRTIEGYITALKDAVPDPSKVDYEVFNCETRRIAVILCPGEVVVTLVEARGSVRWWDSPYHFAGSVAWHYRDSDVPIPAVL